MEIHIKRKPIGEKLIEEVALGTARLESSLIIAQWFGGKRYLADHLEPEVHRLGMNVVRFEFPWDHIITTESELVQSIRDLCWFSLKWNRGVFR